MVFIFLSFINWIFCNLGRKEKVPAERDEAVFEHSDIGVAGACIHSVFVSYFEMIMFI